MATNTYYVSAVVDKLSGEFAVCDYFLDAGCTEPAELPLRVAPGANACTIAQSDKSALTLIGSVYKTLGQPPAMNGSNFAPANDEKAVAVVMPVDKIVTKGVVLLFADPQAVTCIYPSSDPEVTNDPI